MLESKEKIIAFLRSHERVVFLFALFCFISFTLFYSPKRDYPVVVSIPRGAGLKEVSLILEKENIIRIKTPFIACSLLLGWDQNIKAGVYEFFQRTHPCKVSLRLVRGDYGLVASKVTITEGQDIFSIAETFKDFPQFDEKLFLEEAQEGFLFPDTYFVLPDINHEELIKIMEDRFYEKIKPFEDEIKESGKSLNEIITMASIIEREAGKPEDRRIISGILWERIRLGIPLQVDATFSYVNGKNTYELSLDDLFIESEFNTYRNKGLPPTPIANPSIDSIEAALRPTETEYLYFLSDLSGKMYYAKDFEGHQFNRERYLRK